MVSMTIRRCRRKVKVSLQLSHALAKVSASEFNDAYVVVGYLRFKVSAKVAPVKAWHNCELQVHWFKNS